MPRRFQNRMDQFQTSRFIFDVFQHIEKADRSGAPRWQVRVLEPRTDNRLDRTRAGGQSAIDAGLNQNAVNACGDESLCNITIAAANIEKHPAAMELAYNVHDHLIAVPEPKRSILNRKACGIAVSWIGHRGLLFPGKPKSRLSLLQGRRQGCEIELRNYKVLLSL